MMLWFKYKSSGALDCSFNHKTSMWSRTFNYDIRSTFCETDYNKMCQKNVTKLENYGEIGS